MITQLRQAFIAIIILTILTGVIYPLTVTGVAQLMLPRQANGSLLEGAKGSALVGQPFDDPRYFWGRLSGAGYNAAASSGTNYAMTNPALVNAAKARIEALKLEDPGNVQSSGLAIPVDLVTASGSGLDPHISPAAARYQVARVAKARNMTVAEVEQLVAQHTQQPTLGILGEERVNVVLLNRALDLK